MFSAHKVPVKPKEKLSIRVIKEVNWYNAAVNIMQIEEVSYIYIHIYI